MAVNEEELKPIIAKKYNTRAGLRTFITQRAKEEDRGDEDEDSKAWLNQLVWGALL